MSNIHTIYCSYKRSSQDKGENREYKVTFLDDTPERSAVIEQFPDYFFEDYTMLHGHLWDMNCTDAQRYLDEHPTTPQYSGFTLRTDEEFSTEDFANLHLFPELKRLNLYSNLLTDHSLEHLTVLKNLEWLAIRSEHLTEKCLDSIIQFPALDFLSLQGCPNISRFHFEEITHHFDSVSNLFPPT